MASEGLETDPSHGITHVLVRSWAAEELRRRLGVQVRGLDSSVYKSHGMTDADWETFVGMYARSSLVPTDEASNMATTTENRLLYIPYWRSTATAAATTASTAAPTAAPTSAGSTAAPSTAATDAPTTAAPTPASPTPSPHSVDDLQLCSDLGTTDGYGPWILEGECPQAGGWPPGLFAFLK